MTGRVLPLRIHFRKVSGPDEYDRYEFEALEPIVGMPEDQCGYVTGFVSKTWDRVYGNHWIAYRREGDEFHAVTASDKTRKGAALSAAKVWLREQADA